MPPARNARGIDIVAYNESGDNFLGLQVKALSKRNPVPLGKTLDKVMGDFWVIVNNVSDEPNTYITLPAEVKKLAHRGVKESRVSYWLQTKAYDAEEFKQAWSRIRLGLEA